MEDDPIAAETIGKDDGFNAALANLPEGFSSGHFHNVRYGVTITRSADARRISLFARELGGNDIVSFNLYQLKSGADGRRSILPNAPPAANTHLIPRDLWLQITFLDRLSRSVSPGPVGAVFFYYAARRVQRNSMPARENEELVGLLPETIMGDWHRLNVSAPSGEDAASMRSEAAINSLMMRRESLGS